MASTFQQPQPILVLNMPQFHYLHNYSNMMVGDQPIQVRDNDYHHHAGGGMISLSSQEGGGKHYGDGGSYTSATTSSSSSSSSGSSYSSSEESSAAEEEAQGHASVAPSTTSSTKTPGGLSVYRFDDSVLCAVSELGDVAPTLAGQDEEDDDDQFDRDVPAYMMNNTDDDGTECAFANMSVYERDDTTVSTMTTTTRAVPRPVMRVYPKDDDTAVSSISGVMSHLAIATTTSSTPTNTNMIKSSDYSRVSSGLSTVPGGEATAASSSMTSSSSSHSKSTKNNTNMTYLQSILEIGDADAGRPSTPTSSSKRKKDKPKMSSSSSIASSSLAPPKKKKSGLLRRLFPTTAQLQQQV